MYLGKSLNLLRLHFHRFRRQKWVIIFGQKLEIPTIVGWWLVINFGRFFYQGSKIGTAVNTAHSFSPVQVLYLNNT